jgi:chromosomal replication initiator protein
MTDETWGQVREELIKRVGKNNYKTWIEPLRLSGLKNGVARFEVPTSFFGDWVSRNFADQIRGQLSLAGNPVERVEFTVVTAPRSEDAARATSPAISAPAPRRNATARVVPMRPKIGSDGEISGAQLEPRFTFDSFVVGKPNELAYAAARRVAEAGPVTYNPLFLYGGVGLGKTHLMHAIAHELQQSRPDLHVLYLSAEQFMYRFVQALRDKQIMDFKELFRSVDVLMVDDVQFIAGKDSTQEEFFHTFNALVDQNKQIVISADRAPGEIKDLEERIRSRLQCGLVVDLHPTDYELRLGILQAKVNQ